ncbi:MAG: DUF4351 domain-containing protein [Cyanomargarita calcarea GSE-NOS-MK-12-04C]|jgi:hypothetical protein|uniref:DUF4351 domain-containing protein n=1 Tax=Cyanomargarita calcarea GSE-NOS-MK-12-04C TaxID=2839659 RepID=A0A951QIS9_9CYAN|nr:DUF4351 domain-containing protein [Cyanomargarita calcarea GSE-NOS-MK-12-04C]
MRLLKRKIGSLAPKLEVRISQLPTNQLEDLAEALLDFYIEGDLVAWLATL